MRRWRRIVLVAACIGIAAPATPALAAKHATWQQVRASLTSAGFAPYRNVAKTSASADLISSPRDESPYWSIWVFRNAVTRNGDYISGYDWKMRLVGKYPGPIYWTHWVPLLAGVVRDGSYQAVKLYGDNLVLVFDVAKNRKRPHPRTADEMPGTWVALDEALSALTK